MTIKSTSTSENVVFCAHGVCSQNERRRSFYCGCIIYLYHQGVTLYALSLKTVVSALWQRVGKVPVVMYFAQHLLQ